MEYCKIPLIVGLIGHRKIRPSELERVQREFDLAIERLLSKFKYTELVILTSLADGADRVAHSSQHRDRLKIVGVLPFGIDDYRRDFTSIESQRDFDSIVNQCDEIVINGSSYSPSDLIHPEMRARAYAETAEWLTENSKVLIAIWDGNFTGKVGGTGETIRKSMDGFSTGNFIHILAANAESVVESSCGCSGHSFASLGEDASLKRKDLFNRYIKDDSPSIFEVFDRTATQLRREYDRRVKISLFLGFILINAVSIEQSSQDSFWLVVVASMAILTIVYWLLLKRSRIKEVYEDLRVVAESLRVEYWLESAGVGVNAFEAMGVKELIDPWLSELLEDLHKWEEISAGTSVRRVELPIDWPKVTSWLDDQIDYLDGTKEKLGAIGRNLRKAERYDLFARVSILSGVSIYILSRALVFLLNDSLSLNYQEYLGVVFSLTLSISALSLALSQLMGHKEIAARYSASLRVLKNGAILLDKALDSGDNSESQLIVKEIGLESLQETLYWFTVRRTRDVRPL